MPRPRKFPPNTEDRSYIAGDFLIVEMYNGYGHLQQGTLALKLSEIRSIARTNSGTTFWCSNVEHHTPVDISLVLAALRNGEPA